ncbi:MAG TPA: TetR/AcrR family transcriptional regulator, partial [Mycobacterium sp.]
DEYRVLVAGLLANAKAHGAIRDDAAVTDLDLLFWSLRGIIETAGELSTPAWRRQAAICLAGLRPSSDALADLPIGEEVVAHSRESSLLS